MLKIRKEPIYRIDVYEGSITIGEREYEFLIDYTDSYAEIRWDIFGTDEYNTHKDLLISKEYEILQEFEKMMNNED